MNNHEGQLVFSSRVAPIELKLELPDLQSRLTQAVSVKCRVEVYMQTAMLW